MVSLLVRDLGQMKDFWLVLSSDSEMAPVLDCLKEMLLDFVKGFVLDLVLDDQKEHQLVGSLVYLKDQE